MTRRWSLQRRLTSWITLSVGALFVVGVSSTAWLVHDSLHRELDLLIVEELAELTVECLREEIDPARLQHLGREAELEHPGFRLGWRVWLGKRDKPWSTGGVSESLPFPAHDAAPDNHTLVVARSARWRRKTIQSNIATPSGPEPREILIEVLLDGSRREHELRKTGAFFLIVTLVGSLVIILGGALLARRLARMLRYVAESASTARLSTDVEPRPLPDAPDEIRMVADAFRVSVGEMRAEHSRNLLLTAGLAHELRSPMQNMISGAEVALLRDRENAEYKQIIAEQLDEMLELAHVVDNLITLSALRDTEELARHEQFDLGNEVDLRLDKEHTAAERRAVNLDVLQQGDLMIDGDREALLLMLRNLIGNAIRWTARGTKVRVVLDGQQRDMKISVEDRGQGIPPEERERVFEAFYQGAPPSGARMGYGLGLALAKAAVRAHGGEIRVVDGEHGGARFEVTLLRDTPQPG